MMIYMRTWTRDSLQNVIAAHMHLRPSCGVVRESASSSRETHARCPRGSVLRHCDVPLSTKIIIKNALLCDSDGSMLWKVSLTCTFIPSYFFILAIYSQKEESQSTHRVCPRARFADSVPVGLKNVAPPSAQPLPLPSGFSSLFGSLRLHSTPQCGWTGHGLFHPSSNLSKGRFQFLVFCFKNNLAR